MESDSIKLSEDYNKEHPPFFETNDTITPAKVYLYLNILRDPIVKESEQTILLDAAIYFIWVDNRVMADEGDVILVNEDFKDKLWLPKIAFYPARSLNAISGLGASSFRLYFRRNLNYFEYQTRWSLDLICEMQFDSFPMDIQACSWIIEGNAPHKYLDLTWASIGGLKLKNSSWGSTDMKLPSFRLRFKTHANNPKRDFLIKRLYLTVYLYRDLSPHLLMTYFPSGLLVALSWCSFIINPEMVPGRVTLMMTTLLTLVTMFNSLRQKLSPSFEVKPVEQWFIACMMFVVGALLEYAVLLLSSRCSLMRNKAPEPHPHAVPSLTHIKLFEHLPKHKERRMVQFWKNRRCVQSVKSVFRREGILDTSSFIIFPLAFIAFNYWFWHNHLDKMNKRWKALSSDH